MPTLAPIPGYGVTKGSLVETAFEYCGLAGYEFERTPEEIASGMRALAMLMMEAPFDRAGFNVVDFGFGLPEEGSNLLNADVPAIGFFLALRMATLQGKTLPSSFFAMANPSMYAFKARYAIILEQAYRPGTIRGSGARNDFNYNGAYFPESAPIEDIVDVSIN